MPQQKIARHVRTVDFESLLGAAVLMYQPHVVKHRSCIEKLRIELQSATLPARAPQ